MKCPNCSTDLIQTENKFSLIDKCPNCGGTWFEEGEFKIALQSLLSDTSIKPNKANIFNKSIETVYKTQEQKKACPKCSKELTKHNFSYDSNVFIDVCTNGHGTWVDEEELSRLASYLKENPNLTELGKGLAIRDREIQAEKEYRKRIARTPVGMYLNMLPEEEDTNIYLEPAYVTTILIVLNIITFIIPFIFAINSDVFIYSFGLYANNLLSYQLLTSMFIHGGIVHLISNMYFLYVFGDNVERQYGHLKYLFMYLIWGVFSSIVFSFSNNTSYPAIGASGAISGIMGAYFILFPHNKIRTAIFYAYLRLPAWVYLLIWLGLQILNLSTTTTQTSNTAWIAHISGFISGAVITYILKDALAKNEEM